MAFVDENTVKQFWQSIVSKFYQKPATGIPKTDLASGVQSSLELADTALQSVPNTYRTASAQDVIDNGKQATLVSGQNIKTVGGNSILGSGDIPVGGSEAQFELIEKIIVGYSITTQQPADWETNYTDYFTNTGTLREPVYTAVTGESAPTWESGMYYSFTSPITDFIRIAEPDGTPYAFSKIFLYSPKLKGTTNSSYGRLIVNSNSKYDYRNQLFSDSFQGLFTNTEREVAITLTLKGNDLSKGILGECIVAIGRKIDTSKSVYKFTSRVWNQNSIIKRLQFGGTEQTVDGNTEISVFGVRA